MSEGRWRKIPGPVRKGIVITFGGLLLLLGVVFLVLPGPGIPLIIAGLAVLGAEYHWARRLLESIKDRFKRGKR
ncbi:MAG: PGPGW domain-containing protein [Candidatus Paceibacterota bacterium]